MKSSSYVAPNLISQVTAYQENFQHVESLIEDSKTKAAALASVDELQVQMAEVSTCTHIIVFIAPDIIVN